MGNIELEVTSNCMVRCDKLKASHQNETVWRCQLLDLSMYFQNIQEGSWAKH